MYFSESTTVWLFGSVFSHLLLLHFFGGTKCYFSMEISIEFRLLMYTKVPPEYCTGTEELEFK